MHAHLWVRLTPRTSLPTGSQLWGPLDLRRCDGLRCVPSNSYVRVPTPRPQNVTSLERGVFTEVMKLKRGRWGVPTPVCLVCLWEEEIRTRMTEGRPHGDAGGDGRLLAQETRVRRSPRCRPLDRGRLSSTLRENKRLALKPRSPRGLVTAAGADWRTSRLSPPRAHCERPRELRGPERFAALTRNPRF